MVTGSRRLRVLLPFAGLVGSVALLTACGAPAESVTVRGTLPGVPVVSSAPAGSSPTATPSTDPAYAYIVNPDTLATDDTATILVRRGQLVLIELGRDAGWEVSSVEPSGVLYEQTPPQPDGTVLEALDPGQAVVTLVDSAREQTVEMTVEVTE